MRASTKESRIRLSWPETRIWNRCHGPTARGREVALAARMRRDLMVLAGVLAERVGRPARVVTARGEQILEASGVSAPPRRWRRRRPLRAVR